MNTSKPLRSYAWSILVVFLMVGWIYPAVGIMALVCMIAPIVVALFSGKRKWCAMFCPRGIFNDVILAKISRHQKAPALLTSNYFKIGFLFFLIANLIIGIINAGGNITAMGLVFVRLVSLTTAIAIVLGYIYSQRTWCGFCPMGFLATLSIKAKRLIKAPRQTPNPSETEKYGVVFYTGEQCPACDSLKEQLQNLKVTFKEINIDRNKAARTAMATRYNTVAVPALSVEGKLIQDINKENLKKILGQKNTQIAS